MPGDKNRAERYRKEAGESKTIKLQLLLKILRIALKNHGYFVIFSEIMLDRGRMLWYHDLARAG